MADSCVCSDEKLLAAASCYGLGYRVQLWGMALAPTPAKARVFVSVGVPLPGVRYYAPPLYYPYAYPIGIVPVVSL